ncbi:MAG: hypothetical protein PHZ25_01205 [Candidatus Pacebacteria bacterium]|nr:hypothetical protein [Candidatus Paceibacterota bacterium]
MEKKKIVICASVSFEDQIIEWKNKLEKMGFEVIKYPTKIKEDLLTVYNKEFSEHYDAISKADVVLVLNLDKKGISGYIGSGVFAEMAFALGLNKVQNKNVSVYHLNPISKGELPYSDELELWQNLGWIKLFEENRVEKV